jgi:predicted nuclease of predicted toxin-antitoxin system
MRVLLDECLPRRPKRVLSAHEVRKVPEAGWAGKQNGELLRLATGAYDVFITLDQNLQYQQHIAGVSIAVVVMVCRSNRLEDLLPLVPSLLDTLQSPLRPGEVGGSGVNSDDQPTPDAR